MKTTEENTSNAPLMIHLADMPKRSAITPKTSEAKTPPHVTINELIDNIVDRIFSSVFSCSNTLSELFPTVKRKKNNK
jgi:hypothetical protein